MTNKQKHSIVSILLDDCGLCERYKKGRNTCAIGALAVAATTPGSKVWKAIAKADRGNMAIDSDEECIEIIRNRINAKFGTTNDQLNDIQKANDSVVDEEYDTVSEARTDRQRAVISVVVGFETNERL